MHYYLKHQITCTNQQDDSSLPLKTRQEHTAALTNILLHIYLLKDMNKLKGILLKPGNSAFIADAIRRFFVFLALTILHQQTLRCRNPLCVA